MHLGESLGITVKTMSTESPWGNALIEWHNLILAYMLDKILEESNCDIDLAVIWSVNAKNSSKLVSTVFYHFYIFCQMIALQKL